MNTQCMFTALALACASVAAADGDADKGKTTFNKCRACHSIVDAEGVAIVKGGRTGPNLYGVVGRSAAGGDFRYSKTLIAAGEGGLIWDQVNLAEFIADPRGYLKGVGTDGRTKMTFKLRKGGEDITAYLATFSPVIDESEDGVAEEPSQEVDAATEVGNQ